MARGQIVGHPRWTEPNVRKVATSFPPPVFFSIEPKPEFLPMGHPPGLKFWSERMTGPLFQKGGGLLLNVQGESQHTPTLDRFQRTMSPTPSSTTATTPASACSFGSAGKAPS